MGIIFDIQRLTVHDGPGIRTTVFLKGCPLRCKWCHNPESYIKDIQLQYIEDKCIGCRKCMQVCCNKVHAFEQMNHSIDFDHCVQCGQCVSECPSQAVDFFGKEISSRSVLDLVDQDKAFFGKEGGVTFSGGEVMQQIDFLQDLLMESKKRGYHTCVDTSGCASWDSFLRIIPYTDCFLYDVKAWSSDIHREATGADNRLILDNLNRLASITSSEKTYKVYVRIPLIKEYNAKQSELTPLAKWLELLDIEGVTLMPYHVLGRSKREMIGLKKSIIYTAPSNEEMKAFKDIFGRFNNETISKT